MTNRSSFSSGKHSIVLMSCGNPNDRIQASLVYPDSSQELLTLNPHVRITIGRDPDCTIVINDPEVSRHHLYVQFYDDHVRVRDDSKNGSWVGSEYIKKKTARLYTQQAIRVAGHVLTFYWPAQL